MGRREGEGSDQVAVWVCGCWPRPTHSRPLLQRSEDSQFKERSKHSQIPHSHGRVWRDCIILRNMKAHEVLWAVWNHWSVLYDLFQQATFSVKGVCWDFFSMIPVQSSLKVVESFQLPSCCLKLMSYGTSTTFFFSARGRKMWNNKITRTFFLWWTVTNYQRGNL